MPNPSIRYRVTYIFDSALPPEEIDALARRSCGTTFPGPWCTALVGYESEHTEAPSTAHDDDATPADDVA